MSCAACGGGPLCPHLAVAGQAGPDGLVPTTTRFGTALADIVECANCGHGQLEIFPTDEELAAAYAEAESEDYVDEEAGQRETARRVLARIDRHAPDGPLVDLGCWVGFLLAEARERGRRVIGVEPSGWAARYAREELYLPEIHETDLFAAPVAEGEFAAAVLGDVLEHLPRPGEALDRIGSLLAPGGVVCLVLPDAGSALARAMGARWWSVIPTHVQYFTRGSLRTLLARHDFEVLELGTSPKAFSVRYYLERIGGYSPPLARALVAVARRARLAEKMWAPDFGDRMVVIARPRPRP